MCPSESEIFDSVLDNAVELDEEPKRPFGRILLFLPRLVLRLIAWPFRWLSRGMQP